jgi:hypothetical protein
LSEIYSDLVPRETRHQGTGERIPSRVVDFWRSRYEMHWAEHAANALRVVNEAMFHHGFSEDA